MKPAGFLPLVYLILSGCGLSPAYLDQKHDEQVARYSASCEKLGFAKGTKENADCAVRMFEAKQPIRVQQN